jgi:hypothetical protein
MLPIKPSQAGPESYAVDSFQSPESYAGPAYGLLMAHVHVQKASATRQWRPYPSCCCSCSATVPATLFVFPVAGCQTVPFCRQGTSSCQQCSPAAAAAAGCPLVPPVWLPWQLWRVVSCPAQRTASGTRDGTCRQKQKTSRKNSPAIYIALWFSSHTPDGRLAKHDANCL